MPHRVRASQHGVCQSVHAGCLARSGGPADDDVRHVPLLCDDLQPIERLLVAHHLQRYGIRSVIAAEGGKRVTPSYNLSTFYLKKWGFHD